VRLFVGVEIDPPVAAAFSSVSAELQRRASTCAPHARITWVPAERAHVTVRFIGHVDEAKANDIAESLKAPLETAAFDVVVGGMGAFPPGGAPRVIWAGLGDGVAALIDVEREVSERLEGCAVQREERAYRPHVTLARVREAAGLRTRVLLEELTDRAFGTTRVDAITLFESRLSPKGPTYVALQRTPLRRV
jgi:2'-5' RNA ligase